MKKRITLIFALLLLLSFFALQASAEGPAEKITGGISVRVGGADRSAWMQDGSIFTMAEGRQNQLLEIKSSQPFAALYITWDRAPTPYTVTWEGGSVEGGQGGFLHDYVALPAETTAVTLDFGGQGFGVCDIALYTSGEKPAEVQQWEAPDDEADILVFATHADDDVLYFGPLISRCVTERQLDVQVAFMVAHTPAKLRSHERLDGLWALGVRRYPIIGPGEDYKVHGHSTVEIYHRNDDILGWQIGLLRRFRPMVTVGHDLEGEYGNCQHSLNAEYLTRAVAAANDPLQSPQSAELYGTWDTPKLYLHLYPENEITLDVNTPVAGDPLGRTPFQIAQDAFLCHKSQQGAFRVTQEDPRQDCRKFGLYRSLVGPDSTADIMENIDF